LLQKLPRFRKKQSQPESIAAVADAAPQLKVVVGEKKMLGSIQAIMMVVLLSAPVATWGVMNLKHKWVDLPIAEQRARDSERSKWVSQLNELQTKLNESTQKTVENFQAGQAEPVNIDHGSKANVMMACNKPGSGCRERGKKQ
jgi:hypothetical protein